VNRRTSWRTAAIAVAVAVLAVAAAIAATAIYLSRHIDRETATAAQADAEFARLRARFVREEPLVEVTAEGDVLIHPNTGNGGAIHTVHVVAFDPASKRLVRAALPVWLLRTGRSRAVSMIDQSEFGAGGAHLTLEDLERHGPGLILDRRSAGGGQTLVWAE
jgi:hypothetical protein